MNNNSYTNQVKHVAMALLLGAGFNMMLTSVSSAGDFVGAWTRSSTVGDTVTDNNNGTWSYGYTVSNTSQFGPNGTDGTDFREAPIIVDWELPWFNDAGISSTSIVSPTNWAWAIETIGVANFATGWGSDAAWQDPTDPFYEGASSPYTTGTQVLHWYNVCWLNNQNQSATLTRVAAAVTACEGTFDNAVFVGESLAGFGFDAAFDQTAAPYQASWSFLPIRTGDPAFPLGGPASPQALGQAVAVPEPGALALFGAAMMALVWSRRRRQA